MSNGGFAIKRPKAVQEIPIEAQKLETDPFDWRYTNARSATDMNEFPLCVKFDSSWVGYSVPSFTRNMTDGPGYQRQALMSNATFHNGCFNTPNTTLRTVADDVRYVVPESPIPYERYNTEVAGFQRENARSYDKAVRPGRTLNGFLYPMEGRDCEGTLRPAQPPRMRLGFSHQLL
ncbi:hypothetical protein AB3S75_020393 [Citrus x aurantiifolia]